ncbi:MAG: formate dehydrogenase subunit delta [Thiothrix sp.]|nr:formate dehydrogenase subunit delta [Thiothrix sp.]HPE59081.1 formate dehydrogenase subunit delta [Thiolinea sp.]
MSPLSQRQHLIKMLNQIASNNLYQDNEEAAADRTADHVRRFWARSMKAEILACTAQDGSALLPAARMALERLKRNQAG